MIRKENVVDWIIGTCFQHYRWQGIVCMLVVLLQPVAASAGPRVFVTNYPLKYFTERIAGDTVEVVLPVPANMDPHNWMPDRKTILAMQQADLILLNGAGYEQWLTMASLPKSRQFNTSSSLKGRYVRVPNQSTHNHGPGGEHSHELIRYTIWIDFQLAVAQAKAISSALIKRFPQQIEEYSANSQALVEDLQNLDEQFAALFARRPGLLLFASQPVYDYFARRYALNIHSLVWLPQTMASPKQWQDFEQLLRKYPAQWMLWRDRPMEAIEKRLEQAGVATVIFDTCDNEPGSGDFLSVMQDNYQNMRKIFH